MAWYVHHAMCTVDCTCTVQCLGVWETGEVQEEPRPLLSAEVYPQSRGWVWRSVRWLWWLCLTVVCRSVQQPGSGTRPSAGGPQSCRRGPGRCGQAAHVWGGSGQQVELLALPDLHRLLAEPPCPATPQSGQPWRGGPATWPGYTRDTPGTMNSISTRSQCLDGWCHV